jgi:hypothetical protein
MGKSHEDITYKDAPYYYHEIFEEKESDLKIWNENLLQSLYQPLQDVVDTYLHP